MRANGRPSQGKFLREEHVGKTENTPRENQPTVPPGTILKARRGERAKRVERPGRGTPSLRVGESIVSIVPPRKALTYSDLTEYHLNKLRFDEDGKERSSGVLKNHRSVIRSWVRSRLLPAGNQQAEVNLEQFALGEEIGVNFTTSLDDYLKDQEKKKKKSTVNDRRSIMLSVRESAAELIRLDGLPEDFAGALDYLVRNSGMTRSQIAEVAGFEESRIYKWTTGKVLPFLSSLPQIERLEDLFNVRRGTLSGRLPLFE